MMAQNVEQRSSCSRLNIEYQHGDGVVCTYAKVNTSAYIHQRLVAHIKCKPALKYLLFRIPLLGEYGICGAFFFFESPKKLKNNSFS